MKITNNDEKKPSPACHEFRVGETTIFVSVILLKHLILEYVIFLVVGIVFFVFVSLHAKVVFFFFDTIQHYIYMFRTNGMFLSVDYIEVGSE